MKKHFVPLFLFEMKDRNKELHRFIIPSASSTEEFEKLLACCVADVPALLGIPQNLHKGFINYLILMWLLANDCSRVSQLTEKFFSEWKKSLELLKVL